MGDHKGSKSEISRFMNIKTSVYINQSRLFYEQLWTNRDLQKYIVCLKANSVSITVVMYEL